MRKCEVARMKINKKFRSCLITYAIVIIAFVICEVALNGTIDGFTIKRSLKNQLVPVCAYIVLAVSLNLTVGISGELSLGHAGFMSVGAFTGVVAASWFNSAFALENDTINLIISMCVGGAFAGGAAVLVGIPALRLRGDYLAIVLLAFGEIIRNLLNCVYVAVDGAAIRLSLPLAGSSAPVFEKTAKVVIDGAKGTKNSVMSVAFNNERFIVAFALVMLTLIVIFNLINSRSGRAIMAIRDNRIAAESTGLNVMKYKMMAFVTSAVLAGMAGALYGLNMRTVTAVDFDYNMSIEILLIVVLGGIGSIRGSVIAAVLLKLLPEQLRFLQDYRMLVYAIVLILVMLATNSPILKNLVAWLGGIKSIADIGKGVAGGVRNARNGVLAAEARVMGGLAGGLSGMAGWLEKKQHALENKASGVKKNDGKAGDAE